MRVPGRPPVTVLVAEVGGGVEPGGGKGVALLAPFLEAVTTEEDELDTVLVQAATVAVEVMEEEGEALGEGVVD